ncbi:MAG: sulfite exporter TauE/SafE family protein [Candidatus Melainabacteria bacterium]|nr:sulfite exporter TauE/SafE family protein [Candidatus Melainabacteria bacterium]
MFLDVFLGLFTGTLLGLLGGGGSIIAVPILVYVIGLQAKTAIGTSLVIVGLASFFAVLPHWRRNCVSLRIALLFGASGAIGSYLGGVLAGGIPDQVQLIMFALVMALVGILMLTAGKNNEASRQQNSHQLSIVLAAGLGAGLLTGLLGVGGGFIIVPALMLVLGLPMKQAVGTSLLVIGMNSLVGATAYASHISFTGSVLPFGIGTILSAPVAGHFAHYIEQGKLKVGFALALLLLSAWMFIKQLIG